MVTFACKKIKLEEVVRCSFGLNKTEYKSFLFLLSSNKKFTVTEMANNFSLKRTTIQKSVKNLLEKKLVNKFQINRKKGGYEFYYTMSEKVKIKAEIKRILDEWVESAKKKVDEL